MHAKRGDDMGGRGSRSTAGGARAGAASQSNARMALSIPLPSEAQPGEVDFDEVLYFFDTASDAEIDAFFDDLTAMPIGPGEADTDIQRFYNYLGISDTQPDVMDETAFKKAFAAEKRRNPDLVMQYHAVHDTYDRSAQDLNVQLMGKKYTFSGEAYKRYAFFGVHGGGTYFAADDAAGSAGYGINQVHGFISSDANIITSAQMKRDFRQFISTAKPRVARRFNALETGYGGGAELAGVYAALRGYQVITDWQVNSTGAYNVVIDHSVLTMSSKTKAVGRGRRVTNW